VRIIELLCRYSNEIPIFIQNHICSDDPCPII
jgi:hypothetical protein